MENSENQKESNGTPSVSTVSTSNPTVQSVRPSVLTWRDEMHSQLERGKHVLLYGNVDDRYLLNEARPRTVLLAQCLNHYFLAQNFQIIVHYDLADGMRTAIPELMDPLLLSLLDGSVASTENADGQENRPAFGSKVTQTEVPGTEVSGVSMAQLPLTAQAAEAVVELELASQKRRDAMRSSLFSRRSEIVQKTNSEIAQKTDSKVHGIHSVGSSGTLGSLNSGSSVTSENPVGMANSEKTETTETTEKTANSTDSLVPVSLSSRSRSAEDVIPQLRRVLAQEQIPTAVVIHFSDKLFDDTRRQNRGEREYLLHLKKILTEAATVHQGQLAGRRNALILVASKLAAVPTWLYQEQPLLALVRIPSPQDEERRRFIEGFWKVFTRNAPLEETRRADYIQTFVDQTQGLALWDLMSLGALANRSVDGPIDEPKELRRLISLYRYGQKEDPWEKFNSGDRRGRIQDARESIERRVKGQPEAVNAIVEMLISATVGITFSPSTRQTGKPKGVFFFVGPTGVGKTELAKALAELIFGDEARLRRFDMSEFSESHAAEKLTGSPPGYVGYEEGGQLTNFVRENPFSLLLFDEIEKAHGQVMDKFLQILEDGRLTDSKGQTAFFSQSVIIFTSNIGADSLFEDDPHRGVERNLSGDSNSDSSRNSNRNSNLDSNGDSKGASNQDFLSDSRVSDSVPDYETFVRKHFQEKVRDHFVHVLKRPEILNRFGDNIIVFDVLRPRFVRAIGEKFLAMLKISAQERRGLTLEFAPSVLQFVEKAMMLPQNIKNGGRRIRTLLEDRLEKKLNRWVFEHQPEPGAILVLSFDEAGILEVQEF